MRLLEGGASGVVYGSGPRVRLYCLYGDKAISGDGASESALAFNPTEGDWRMSLPCRADDLDWVRDALKRKSSRITARDLDESIESDDDSAERKASSGLSIGRHFSSHEHGCLSQHLHAIRYLRY